MSDDFADRMREFGERLGWNRAERRKHGLTKAKAKKMGYLSVNPDNSAPSEKADKQVRIQKPKPKGRPSSK